MPRIRMLVALTAAAALAVPGVASAAASKVTGGSTQVTVSSAVASALSANHITVTALAPATSSGTTYTFPVKGGRINAKLHGDIRHAGGLEISNGTTTVRLRRLTIVSDRSGVWLRALVAGTVHKACHVVGRRHHRMRCVSVTRYATRRIAALTDVNVTGTSATANVALTTYSAKVINVLAGKALASPGIQLGTAKVTFLLG